MSGLGRLSAVGPRLLNSVMPLPSRFNAATTITSPLALAGSVSVRTSGPLLPALFTKTTPSLVARSAVVAQTEVPSISVWDTPQLQLIIFAPSLTASSIASAP